MSNQDVHVTSEAILGIKRKLEQTIVPNIITIRGNVDQTSVPFPGFGIIGLGFQVALNEAQDYARNYLQAAEEAIEAVAENLQVVADNWRAAEDANRVRY